MGEAYIVAATRTAGGRKGGKLKDWHPADLGGAVMNNLLERTGIDPAAIEDVIVGCVGQVGEQGAHHRRRRTHLHRVRDVVVTAAVLHFSGPSPGSEVDRV